METKSILNLTIIDVREVEGRKSTNMERLGFEKGLDELLEANMPVKEVVTDGHLAIGALVRNSDKYEGIVHQRDIWHGGKNIGKKVVAAAKEKGNEELLLWASAIRNHFWYCSRKCNGDADELKHLWIGILHHIVNEHEWVGDADGKWKCGHGVLSEEDRIKPWLLKSSAVHTTLRKILLSKRLLNELHYYTNFRHTGFLESFHNHLLMYCPKRHSYSFVGYKLRNQLAAIDFNKHVDRLPATTADGKQRHKSQWSKRTKRWRPVAILKPKEYTYIPGLLVKIFEKRRSTTGSVDQRIQRSADDPRNIAENIAEVTRPQMEQLLHDHQSRFGN